MMLLQNLLSFELLIKTSAVLQLIDSAKKNNLNKKISNKKKRETLPKNDIPSTRNDPMC